MSQIESDSPQLNVTNYKRVVKQLIQPHKEQIHNAAQNFKAKIAEYRSASLPRTSQQGVQLVVGRRNSSQFSETSEYFEHQQIKEDKIVSVESQTKNNQLHQWHSNVKSAFPNYNNLSKYYQQLYYAKKCFRKNNKDYYDFKIDQKEMLTKIFNQIKNEQNAIQFEAILNFFDKCKLFYLCYNIKPNQLLDLLKESAHNYSNKLTLLQFLNVFFIDRANLTTLYDNQSIKVAKQCILNEQSWKQLKQIFNTLDTFGNQTINMAPFLFKIKNNLANRQLINQPTIEYPEINRTLPMKKIIFNLENRYKFTQKITWPQIQRMIKDFKYQAQPNIDVIYRRLIQRGKITKFSNCFMINSDIVQEIKHIFNRCPKYCEYFIKTKFLCNQLLESNKIKTVMKQTIVRIIRNGNKDYPTTLQQQIRVISKNAENYIDLDQLLEYFTIKGPINTKADVQVDLYESDSQQQEQRLQKLRHVKSADKLISLKKSGKHPKPVRHLTICQQFKLSTKKGQTTMQRRTRQWAQQKQKQIQMQLNTKLKANPIPAELNPQRYKQYLKQLEQIKAIKHKQFLKKKQQQDQVYKYLKTNTKLFTFKQMVKTQPKQQYKFTPKSIPWHILQTNMLQNINNQNALRKKKMFNENKAKILRQWKKLPQVMQKYEQLTQQNNSQKNQHQISQMNLNEDNKNEKNYREKSKVKEVPDFKKLHMQFEQKLNKKKLKFTPTVPIAPVFSELKKRQQKIQINKVSRVRSAEHMKYIQASIQHKTSVQTCIAKQHIQIPTTKKYDGMVELIQQKIQSKQIQKIRQEEAQKERQSKQYNFAKFMQKRLKKTLNKSISLAQLCKNQIKNRKTGQKKQMKKTQEEMYQMYSRVMARPFLFENTDPKAYSSLPRVTESSLQVGYPKKVNGAVQRQKHVHQSPLKYIDPEQESPNKETEKHQIQYESQSQSEQSRNKAYLMNQSF